MASLLGKTRTDVQCLHRWNKVLRVSKTFIAIFRVLQDLMFGVVVYQPGLQKGAWTKEEDHIVKAMVMDIGVAKVKWSYVAEHVSSSEVWHCTPISPIDCHHCTLA